MSKTPRQGVKLEPVERDAVAWVQKLSSGEATREEVDASKRWCMQDPAHAAAFAEAKRVWGRVGAAGRILYDPGEDLVAELDALGQRRRGMNRRAVLGGGAAALVATAAYGLVDPPFGLWPSFSEMDADYRTGTGEQRNIVLGANVAVHLNTQTSLAIQPPQGTEDRIELISGEAAFATSRAARSFAVS